jgi:hypothetical protein
LTSLQKLKKLKGILVIAEHLLMVAPALACGSGLDEFAHHDVDF